MQQLDEQCNSGIFLKFGPFPEFDKYVKLSLNRTLKNIKNKENIKKDNPMTPQEDIDHKYDWHSGMSPPSQSNLWYSTIKMADINYIYWRRLKKD